MKVLVVFYLMVGAFGNLEPADYRSTSNRYMPANRQNSAVLSQRSQYLPPVERAPFNQYNTQASSFGGSHNQRNVDNQYLAPFNFHYHSNQRSDRNYLALAIDRTSSSRYKPYSSSASGSSSSFSSTSYWSSPTSSQTSCSAPSSSFSSPASPYSPPSNYYGASSQGFNRMAAGSCSSQYLSLNDKQGYSSARYQEEVEPANYNFEYQVNDEYGNDFCLKENRQHEKSYRIYSVLLPNGRKQIVEYEADEQEFRPKISYVEMGGGFKNAKSQKLDGPY